MNRFSSLLHRSAFLRRQLLAIRYGHKYTISDKEAKRKAEKGDSLRHVKEPEAHNVAKVLSGFDPESNERDRQILYEVTGIRLIEDEVWDADVSESSSEDDGD